MRRKIIDLSLVLVFIFQIHGILGQNKYVSIGGRKFGICFGNSSKYNGLRLNFRDKYVKKINGINISGWSESEVINGIQIGALATASDVTNGISLGGIGTGGRQINGIAVGGLMLGNRKINGIGIGGFSIDCDSLNGLFISFTGVAGRIPQESNKMINGFAGGFVAVGADKLKGLMVSLCWVYSKEQYGISVAGFNKTENLHGVQLGLMNYAGNNRIFRWMPIMNFNFRKQSGNHL